MRGACPLSSRYYFGVLSSCSHIYCEFERVTIVIMASIMFIDVLNCVTCCPGLCVWGGSFWRYLNMMITRYHAAASWVRNTNDGYNLAARNVGPYVGILWNYRDQLVPIIFSSVFKWKRCMIECITPFPISDHIKIWPNIDTQNQNICIGCQLVSLLALGGDTNTLL